MNTTLLLYLQLSYEFFKTGLFAIGGGLATLPFLSTIGMKYGWYTQQQLADLIAISESTPGPIGVNMATYAGFHTLGIPGALVATISLVAPSVIIIIFIAKFMANFSENRYVKSAFYGLRPAVAAMIGAALISLARITLLLPDACATNLWSSFNLKAILIFVFVFVLINIKKLEKVHPALWLALAAGAGVVLKV